MTHPTRQEFTSHDAWHIATSAVCTPEALHRSTPEALHRSTAADGKTELFSLPGYPLMVRAVDFNRIHAENETLRAGYAAARLEVESLKAQLHAAKQINAAQFGLLAASIPGSALRASHGQAPASVLHLVNSAFAEIAMAFPKAFALHKVGIADTAVREALAAPAGAQADNKKKDPL